MDIKEAAILYYIAKLFEGKSNKVTRIDGHVWVDYGTLLSNMPLLKIKNKNTLVEKIKKLEEYELIESFLIKRDGKIFKLIKQTSLCIYILSQYAKDLDGNIYNGLIRYVGMDKIRAAEMASAPKFWEIKAEQLKTILGGDNKYFGQSSLIYGKFCEWESKYKNY
jgi:hypothetical protein